MKEILDVIHKTIYQFFDVCEDNEEVPMSDKDKLLLEINKAICNNIKALELESCNDIISRQAVLEILNDAYFLKLDDGAVLQESVNQLPPVTSQPKIGRCKDCKYFEYDSVAKINGIPLIVAHEICKRWSDGCKTSEDGYCFLFEPQEVSDKE
jgi:hypothetical protein